MVPDTTRLKYQECVCTIQRGWALLARNHKVSAHGLKKWACFEALGLDELCPFDAGIVMPVKFGG